MGDVVVGVHQPNYFPWLGYFAKIMQSDVFIVLDTVQFEKGGYTNRCKVAVGGAEHWLTQSLQKKGILDKSIKEIEFSDINWPNQHIKTLQNYYAKAPFFRDVAKWLFPLMEQNESLLSSYNTKMLREVCKILEIDTDIVVASDLDGSYYSDPNKRLISLVKKVGGTSYLSGMGAKSYNNQQLFDEADLELRYYSFSQKSYLQQGSQDFLPGLSILDVLFNLGLIGTREMLQV